MGAIPMGAVIGGRTGEGEALYIGRIQFSGSLIPGKVHPSHCGLYIDFAGAEIRFKTGYEVLIEL